MHPISVTASDFRSPHGNIRSVHDGRDNQNQKPGHAGRSDHEHGMRRDLKQLDSGRFRDRAALQLSNVSDLRLMSQYGISTYSFKESFEVEISPEGKRLSYQSSTEYTYSSHPAINNAPITEIVPSLPDPADSANNILNLMQSHLMALAALGATQEKLEDVINQDLKGFIKGRDEAIAILEEMGVYKDAVKELTEKTSKLVHEGIEALKVRYLPVVSPFGDQTTTTTEVSLKRTEFFEEVVSRRAGKHARIATIQQSLLSRQSVSLQVTTNDGDTVTLTLSTIEEIQGQQDIRRGHHRRFQRSAPELDVQGKVDFNVQVNGDLDAGEKEALQKLVDQVSDLVKVFQSGDDAAAFELAQNLELDTGELMSMALDMTQTKTRTTDTYNRIGGYGRSHGSDHHGHHHGRHHSLVKLQSYMTDLNSALQTASQFARPEVLLSDLFSTYLAKIEMESTNPLLVNTDQLLDVNDRILDALTT